MSNIVRDHLRNVIASDTVAHRRSPKSILEVITYKDPFKGSEREYKYLIEYLADVENEADATDREVEPSVRSFLRRLYEDNLDETFHHHKKGGQVKKKRKRSKKKPRGWGKARYGNK